MSDLLQPIGGASVIEQTLMEVPAEQTQVIQLQKQEDHMNQLQAPDKIKELQKLPEVTNLLANIDITNQMQIIEFGKTPAEQISRTTDSMLHSVKKSDMEETSKVMKSLGKVMATFDEKDFEKKQGFLSKMISNIQKKYERMDKDILDITTEIKKYETSLKQDTVDLEKLYQENYNYYLDLMKHIAASHLALENLQSQKPEIQAKAEQGDDEALMDLEAINSLISLFEQKIYDLELSKHVAIQTAPQIKVLQRSNTALIMKINRTIITTLPIFKQALILAIQNKKNKMVDESMKELDATTKELWAKTSQSTAQTAIRSAQMLGETPLEAQDLMSSYNTIMQGLKEADAIAEEIGKTRRKNVTELEKLELEYKQAKLKSKS